MSLTLSEKNVIGIVKSLDTKDVILNQIKTIFEDKDILRDVKALTNIETIEKDVMGNFLLTLFEDIVFIYSSII